MEETFVLLGFFVLLLGLLYQVLKSFLVPANAFLAATATTVLLILGMFGIREGINYETNFNRMRLDGAVRIRPKDNWDSATTIEFTPNSGYSGYGDYILDGKMKGTLT